jgi:hypothetical protein
MCHILRCHDQPVILSACLISMETHPSLTILPESIELSEIRGTQATNNNTGTMQNTGQVLDDVSVTHILTLPTSASVQVRQTIMTEKFFESNDSKEKRTFIDIEHIEMLVDNISINRLFLLACSNNAKTERSSFYC